MTSDTLALIIFLGISLCTMIYLAYKAGHRYELVFLAFITMLIGTTLLVSNTNILNLPKQPYVASCDSTEVVIYAPVDTIKTLQYEIEWE
jgi:hypothetical protein